MQADIDGEGKAHAHALAGSRALRLGLGQVVGGCVCIDDDVRLVDAGVKAVKQRDGCTAGDGRRCGALRVVDGDGPGDTDLAAAGARGGKSAGAVRGLADLVTFAGALARQRDLLACDGVFVAGGQLQLAVVFDDREVAFALREAADRGVGGIALAVHDGVAGVEAGGVTELKLVVVARGVEGDERVADLLQHVDGVEIDDLPQVAEGDPAERVA